MLKTVCAKQEDLPKVKKLIAAGADIDAIDNLNEHITALMYAVRNGHINIAKFLLENNAYVNDITLWEDSALTFAFLDNSPIELFQLLLEKGADFNQRNHRGKTTFDMAKEDYHKRPEYAHCILSTMIYSEVETFSTKNSKNSIMVSGFIKSEQKKLFSIILFLSKKLNPELMPDLTHILEILMLNSKPFISKCYIASPYFKKDIAIFISYILEEKKKKQQAKFSTDTLMTLDNTVDSSQNAQDNDVIFSQETSDLAPQIPSVIFSEEPKKKRKRNESESEENENDHGNSNKKRKINS